MPQLLSRLKFLAPLKKKIRTFFDEQGKWVYDPRSWEDAYRTRWQYDKIVRSTHGVNCTGSCSWKIYVKGGIVTWETQQTDYPRTRPDLPNHEPRGCPRGASYSWYLYSGHRLKYPMVRGVLLKQWREARLVTLSAVDAWTSLVKSPEKRKAWQQQRGLGGFVRASWDEVNEIIAAANIYTIKQYGPDRIAGFSPIPAMSMVSYAAGTRYLSLLGGVCLSFYDWYCDLPPSSPQVWGEQTDVPESADWFNATYLIAWGSNVPQTRTPDAHFFTEARYRGTRTVAVTPDYAEVSKLVDIWLHPKQGTDAAMAMAMGHVILKEFYIDERSAYFDDYVRRYTDMPCLVVLAEKILSDGTVTLVPDRYMRASDLGKTPVEDKQADWKTVAYDQSGACIVHTGSIGFRWDSDHAGQWNLASSSQDSSGKDIRLKLSLMEDPSNYEVASVGFPYFGGVKTPHFPSNEQDTVLLRRIPFKTVKVGKGKQEKTLKVATVFDLLIAHYGVDRRLGGQYAQSYQDNLPYTPMWQSAITGVDPEQVIAVARQFAKNADQTLGKSMVIIGAGMNHWYHNDMNYRSIINLLMMCGCIGKSGGGWAHYVGQEKLRPQTGWTPLAFALDWIRPTRWQNSTSYFYAHSDQWRYEKLEANSILSPLADKAKFHGSMIDYNVRAERMGWLPSAPQLQANPIHITKAAQSAGLPAKEYVVQALN